MSKGNTVAKSIRERIVRTLEDFRDNVQAVAEAFSWKPVPVPVPVRVNDW